MKGIRQKRLETPETYRSWFVAKQLERCRGQQAHEAFLSYESRCNRIELNGELQDYVTGRLGDRIRGSLLS